MLSIATRALVAPFVLLIGTATLPACTNSATHAAPSDVARERAESLRFDNEGRDRVDVYLVGEKRAWRIGLLEPGQARWLRIPRDIPPNDLPRLQLVVLANAEATVAPTRDPRAVTTIRQPVFVLAGQRWAFAEGHLKGVRARQETSVRSASQAPVDEALRDDAPRDEALRDEALRDEALRDEALCDEELRGDASRGDRRSGNAPAARGRAEREIERSMRGRRARRRSTTSSETRPA